MDEEVEPVVAPVGRRYYVKGSRFEMRFVVLRKEQGRRHR